MTEPLKDLPFDVRMVDMATLPSNPKNWKQHPPEQLEIIRQSIDTLGPMKPLGTFNLRTNLLIDGHARKEIYAGTGPVPIWYVDVPEELEKRALATLDPSGWTSTLDKAKFTSLTKGMKPLGATDDLFKNIKRSAKLLDPPAPEERSELPNTIVVPIDTVYPTDNDAEVPLLLADMQPKSVAGPVYQWGSFRQSDYMAGTYHFYAHDYRFEPVWKAPGKVLPSQCSMLVEPNFSMTDQTPFWHALEMVGRKRWLARWWQDHGRRTFVDLNVDSKWNQPHRMLDGTPMNLLGVPKGWNAYATRAHRNQIQALDTEYRLAQEWSGIDKPLFMVVGGGADVEALCQRNQWIRIPEPVDQRMKPKDDDE